MVALTSACGVTYQAGSPSADGPVETSSAVSGSADSASAAAAASRPDQGYRLAVLHASAAVDASVSHASSGSAEPASPQPGTSATPATAEPTPTPATTEPAARDKLQSGDKGDDVLALQEHLNALGYLNGTPDGAFGGLTQQAVYAVQKTAGLDRDGVAGPATLQAIADGVRPVARTSGDAVEIDLDRQLLLVVRGGQLAAIFNTSTGSNAPYSEVIDGKTYTGDAQTYRGTFSVYREVDGPDKAPLGTLYRSKYFDGGIAVHGAPYVPPYPASHGCARVTNWAQDLIWANGWMPMGSTVVVY